MIDITEQALIVKYMIDSVFEYMEEHECSHYRACYQVAKITSYKERDLLNIWSLFSEVK